MWLGNEEWDESGDGFRARPDPDVHRNGPRSLRLIADAGAKGTGRLTQVVQGLTPGRPYRVTFWTRGQGVPEGARLFAGDERVPLPDGDWDWQKTTLTATVPAGEGRLPVGVAFDAGDGPATLWIEDVSVDLTPGERATAEAVDDDAVVVAPDGPARFDGVTAAVEGDVLRLRFASEIEGTSGPIRVTLDPTPAASRLADYEEQQDRRAAEAAAEVINRPAAERRDLLLPRRLWPARPR